MHQRLIHALCTNKGGESCDDDQDCAGVLTCVDGTTCNCNENEDCAAPLVCLPDKMCGDTESWSAFVPVKIKM